MTPQDRLIVALDFDSEAGALDMVGRLKEDVKLFKVGFELFSSCGPSIVGKIRQNGCRAFLDLKFHDIPNTVTKAAVSITRLEPFMLNLHALGGYDMMKMTAEAVAAEAVRLGIERPKVLAVTILTSMDQKALKKIGINATIKAEVLRLAAMAQKAGLDGVVASPREAALIRKKLGKAFLIVTPGVRPAFSASGDQKRIATPGEALRGGADYIVVGRPITGSDDPAGATRRILKEML